MKADYGLCSILIMTSSLLPPDMKQSASLLIHYAWCGYCYKVELQMLVWSLQTMFIAVIVILVGSLARTSLITEHFQTVSSVELR
jgi:hypothetical protein